MHACIFHEDNDIPHPFHISIPTGTFYSTYSHPKRPLPTHSTKASGLFIFPYFFKLLQATQLLFFYAAFTAHTLSLIV